MQRREAIKVFEEISKCIPEAFVTSVSLTPQRRIGGSKDEFELRLDVSVNAKSLENIQSIVNKHRMLLKKEKGSLLICEANEPCEIQVVAWSRK